MTKKKGKKVIIDKSILKLYMPSKLFLLILTAVLLAFIVLYIYYPGMIEREMLFWFFAATSQSMAALLAIIGMMAVFRYQDMQMRLRNLYDSIKSIFIGGDVSQFYLYENPASWEDSIIVSKVKNLLENKPDEFPERKENNINLSIEIIKSHQRVKNSIVDVVKVPALSILITFMVSVFSILFVKMFFSRCHLNLIGLIITLLMIALISLSMVSIVKYFNITLTKQ